MGLGLACDGVDEAEVGLDEGVLRSPARAQPLAVLARASRHPQARGELRVARLSPELLFRVSVRVRARVRVRG